MIRSSSPLRIVLAANAVLFLVQGVEGAPQMSVSGGQGGAVRSSVSRSSHFGTNLPPLRRDRFRRDRFGAVWLPWGYSGWDDDEYWDPLYSYHQPVSPTSPPVVVVESKDSRPTVAPAEPPKIIEVQQSKEAALSTATTNAKKLPATTFVLKSGERLESRYYFLTAQSLQVEVGREQRVIPVSAIDVDATIDANQQRGIELTIPRNGNTVFLSF